MTSLLPILIIAIILSAGLTVAGHYAHPPRPRLVYIFKPLTTALILALLFLSDPSLAQPYTRLIGLGLLFSLMGDIWLVLPRDRFLQGLASFLLAQLCYAYAFFRGASANGFGWALLLLGLVAALVLGYLWPGLSTSLKPAVTVYVAAITAMAALAVGRALAESTTSGLFAATGALLFMASDATLAVSRFRKPFPLSQAVVLGTYYAAQLLIAASTL